MTTPAQLNQPIESASDLHRELTKRGLELRPEVGRDAAIVTEIASKLGIAPNCFLTGLKSSGKSAEEYLRAMISVAEPFAQMFSEIWVCLSRHCAPKAQESLAIRFGFNGGKTSIDWDQFRRMANTTKKVRGFGRVLLWKSCHLHDLARILIRSLKRRRCQRYTVGEAFQLQQIEVNTTADAVAYKARKILQSVIDEIHQSWPQLEREDHRSNNRTDESVYERDLPELKSIANRPGQDASEGRLPPDLGNLLTDLLPLWSDICEQWRNIPDTDKREAEQHFRKKIEPSLTSVDAPVWRWVQEALDLLDLPFWRYRWHTYEVWATVKALDALAAFQPQPVIKNGYIALDGTNPARVAKLSGEQVFFAYVQGETKLDRPIGKRKSIKPDLRFSFDDPPSNSETILIVEFKQRSELDGAHAFEVLTSYSVGAGKGGGVILINYDGVPKIDIPEGCILLGNVHPGRPDKVRAYQEAMRMAFATTNVKPMENKRVVLLDVSSSMASEYDSNNAQRGLKSLLALPWLKIYRFNDGLTSGGDLRTGAEIVTSGGTALGAALQQLYALSEAGIPDRLLIITDGGHDHPDDLLKKCEYRECTPSHIEDHIEWITSR